MRRAGVVVLGSRAGDELRTAERVRSFYCYAARRVRAFRSQGLSTNDFRAAVHATWTLAQRCVQATALYAGEQARDIDSVVSAASAVRELAVAPSALGAAQ